MPCFHNKPVQINVRLCVVTHRIELSVCQLTDKFRPAVTITLPTRISEQSSTLIDNIYTNNIDERESSGILLNQISDHQMIFTLIENFSYVTQAPKFVEIQTNDPESIQTFVNELDELNIYNHLQTEIDSSPDVNYHTILELLSTVKDKHLPKKMVKFNRKKHKKAKWMTNGILKSINTKDKLYNKLVKMDVDGNAQYTTLKKEFNIFKNTLRIMKQNVYIT